MVNGDGMGKYVHGDSFSLFFIDKAHGHEKL